jgi:hypothetical protein
MASERPKVLPIAEMGPGVHHSRYEGTCPSCQTRHVLVLRNEGVVPPVVLALACRCRIPVTSFTGVYVGPEPE